MKDAERLMNDIRRNVLLREGAYLCANGDDFRGYLRARGYDFEDHEFEDMSNSLKLRARDESAACEISDLRQWYFHMRGIS